MSPYTDNKESILNNLNTDMSKGLASSQAAKLFSEFGENKLIEKKKKNNLIRFIEQFKDVMIIILIIAAIISFIIACHEGKIEEFFEPALILIIVIINAIIGMMQESKAEKALEALKNLTAPHARVIRDGKEEIIDAANLVPGDIIKLEAGDFVPADARLLKSAGLKSEESALTGESIPSDKDSEAQVLENAPIGDRNNMVFSGCSITYGTALAVVTATGMNTEMGKIANLLDNETETQTPLQKKLSQLGKYLGIAALAACTVVFIVGLTNNIPLMEIFMTSVSLAVSAIPEGLPAIVTIVLSIGVQRMVKKNAIIRRLPAVETLGSASVICSDKTGTLTQNRMTLVKAYINGNSDTESITSANSEDVIKLLKYAVLCCDGNVIFSDTKKVQAISKKVQAISKEVQAISKEVQAIPNEQHIGDPTETSIIVAAYKNGLKKDDLNKENPRLAEIPFDSDRKLMSTINDINGKIVIIVKGAFDILVTKCSYGDISSANKINEAMSSDALRVLAVAYKELDSLPDNISSDILECDLTLMGLVGMIDPPRPEAKAAVATCIEAGIKPVMITGDHVITASAIARDIGILKDGDMSITGAQLDNMSDDELDEKITGISVYARVSPENKIRIVKAWQKKDHIVSMTGDGVNDAPALKAADIGCAMGITGTDVAKGAADMTLTDDNFATIVDAVKEGRGIYANIKKVVGFLLGTNIGEIITVFAAMLFWKQTPLLSMQLLWINLVTDSMPAIALGMEGVEENIMHIKPKPKNEGIFAHGLGIRIVLQGFMFAILTLIGFSIAKSSTNGLAGGQTLAFMILSLSQVVQVYNMRSESSLFKIGPFTNKKLNIACLISTVLVALVLFTPLSIPFGLIRLPMSLYLIGLLLSLVPLAVMELSKACGVIKHHK